MGTYDDDENRVAELEALKVSDPATFYGKAGRANQYDGAGITEARRLQQTLQGRAPSNFAGPEDGAQHRRVLERVGRLVN
jgi:hypothetical protein